MCGIFGHYTFNTPLTRAQILDLLFCGLRRLEYRGYDSAGISIEAAPLDLNGTDPKSLATAPIIIKNKGNIPALEKLIAQEIQRRPIDVGVLFHNHVGPNAEFAVVHNGIITNFSKLRAVLEEEGQSFETDTDTEVIPRLCALIHANSEEALSFSQLIMQVLRQLEGAYALIVQSTHYPGELVCCRKGSPVVFAVKSDAGAHGRRFRTSADLIGNCFGATPLECFIASDDKAIIEHSREAIALEDGDVLHIKRGGWGIFNVDAGSRCEETVSRVMQKLEGKLESIMKGSYEHFMLKEIWEQPESLTATMAGRVKRVPGVGDPYRAARITLGGLEPVIPTILRSRRLLLVAAGTSYHACVACRPILESLGRIAVAVDLASDMMDRKPPIFRDDTVVFLSQSGETADTLAVLRYAKAAGALCVGVTNAVGSSLSRETHCGAHLNAGYEMGVASTKAYTSQIVVLVMLALLLAHDSIQMRLQRDAIADELLVLPQKVARTLELDAQIKQLAETLRDETTIVLFGRGCNYATVLEAALKIKEIALIHAEGIHAGELKHGPLALIDSSLPVIVLATQDSMHSKMVSVIQQLKARHARLTVICSEGDTEVTTLLSSDSENGASARMLFVPRTEESLQPVVNAVPLQLLAYHLTVMRGLNVDQPRHLAKSVTVTED